MADLTPKTIAELPEDTSLTGAELFPVMDGSTSKRLLLSTLRTQFMQTMGFPTADGSNIDELLNGGTYYVGTPSSMTGTPPPTTYAYKLFVSRAFVGGDSVPRLWQIVQEVGSAFREHRRYYGTSGWTNWVTLDADSINSSVSALNTQAFATYVADANINSGYVGQLRYYRWDTDTLNTPYKENLTSYGFGMIVEYAISADTCAQYCIVGGAPNIYFRRQLSGVWYPWDRMFDSSDIQTGNALANAASNTVTVTSVTFPKAFLRTPNVTISCTGNLSAAQYANIGWSVRSVSTTGFEIEVGVNQAISFSQMGFRWIAVAT